MTKYWLIILALVATALPSWAEELDIIVVGLFADRAVVEINKKQHLLKVGDSSPEGVKLISASSSKAVLEVNGEQATFELGNRVGGAFSAPPEMPKVSLWPTRGMYLTPGTVNGYSVDFLVDTGASAVAFNLATADRLGLDYLRGQQVAVKTASGISKAYKVKLDYVQIEQIKLYNVEAMVIDGPEPSTALLGMTFLGQLDMQHNGERLDLKQKY